MSRGLLRRFTSKSRIDKLAMGNLGATRDWGFSGDYVRAMWLILQQPAAEDFVVATGETHSVHELLESAFSCVGLNWRKYVEVNPKLIRPAEVDCLCGDATKARQRLGWRPTVDFHGLIEMMVAEDLKLVRASGTPMVSISAY